MDSFTRWFSHFSFPNGWKLFPTRLRQKSGHHVRPNQQQYKRLVYLICMTAPSFMRPRCALTPKPRVMYGDLALERHYEELIWKAAHIWNFKHCSPDLLNRVAFPSLQRGEFNSSGLPRTNITHASQVQTHIYLHFFAIWCEFLRKRNLDTERSITLVPVRSFGLLLRTADDWGSFNYS